jgi:uncharacterized protein YdeI (YjbR/CyaY-like superfamily)
VTAAHATKAPSARATVSGPVAFATPQDLDAWLRAHHAARTELWVRVFKKASGTPSVTWHDLVIACLTWGWIDGQRKALDEVSFLQRLTPRRPKSTWSKINCEHAERLIAEGRMQTAGLACVEAARLDGRWEAAYAGSAAMVMPDELLTALAASPRAAASYAALDRRNLYAIYHRLLSAKRAETRSRRIAAIVADLACGKKPH